MQLLGILSALLSALVWGSGDFVGGLAIRRGMRERSAESPFSVVLIASLSGALIMLVAGVLRGEGLLTLSDILWSCAAGISGALGIAVLYTGLAQGSAALVAPTAGVVGAVLPVIAGSFLEGLPGSLQLAGMLLGLGGIWIVSQPASGGSDFTRTDILHGALAGAGFGGFFILIAQVEGEALFLPLVIVKVTALMFSALILRLRGQGMPRLSGNPPALLAGVLDSGGNLFYLLATNYTTLSIAAVLSSMYPVATIILAVALLQQRVASMQWVGILLCIMAVALISA